MWRKLLLHSNIVCLSLTGLAWLVTIVVRFALLNQQLPPGDWLLWVVCNNLMVAGFAYQLGVVSFRSEAKRRHWFRIPGAERHARGRTGPGRGDGMGGRQKLSQKVTDRN